MGLFAKKEKKPQTTSEKVLIAIILIGVFVGFFGLLIYAFNKSSNNNHPSQTPTTDSNPNAVRISQIVTIPYTVVQTVPNKRYDKGTKYYVFIAPVNISNDTFKEDVKAIIAKMVAENGDKISINIFDNKDALDVIYKQYGNNTGDIRTAAEDNLVALHEVAGFSGELSTDQYFNTLHFFPNAFTTTPKVGKYVGTIEFNPEDFQSK